MSWLSDPFPGIKTYIAAVGLAAHGIFLITQGDVHGGWLELMGALATFGLRKAIDRPIDDPAA